MSLLIDARARLVHFAARRGVHGHSIFLLLPVALITGMLCLPILYIASRAHETGWHRAAQLMFRQRVLDLLLNTLTLAGTVTAASIVIGVATAWFIERTHLPGRQAWNAIVTIPFAIPAFVGGYSWISLFPNIEGLGGAFLVTTLTNYPLVHLPVAAALRNMDPALEEVSLSLGYSRRQIFLRVILPYLRPAVLGGGILVALHMLAEFGALAFMNYDTFTTAIFDQYQVAFNSTTAATLTFVLLLLCVVFLGLEMLIRGSSRYAGSGRGASRRADPIPLSWTVIPILAAFVALAILAIGVPFGSLTYWIATGSSAGFNTTEIFDALYATLGFGIGGATLAVFLAVPLVTLAVRHRGLPATLADRLPYFIHSLPGLVVALALVFFAVRYARPLYQTTPLLLIGYAILYLPLAQSAIRGVMVQIPEQLEQVAKSLGKRPPVVFARVVMPLIAPGLGAGFALVCLKIMSELTATLILRPTGVDTLATKVWEHTTNIEYAASAPYAMLLILVSGIPVYILTMRSLSQRG